MKSGFGTLGVVDRDEDTVGCHECGRRFRMLVQHLRLAHEMTVAEYRRLHQLPATVPLTCLSTSELISAQSTARVGSPKWVRFERARDRTLPASQVRRLHARGELDPGRARRIQDAGIPLTVPRGSHWWKRG